MFLFVLDAAAVLMIAVVVILVNMGGVDNASGFMLFYPQLTHKACYDMLDKKWIDLEIRRNLSLQEYQRVRNLTELKIFAKRIRNRIPKQIEFSFHSL